MMSTSATFVRHKAKPGRRDDLWRVWEKYVRDYVAGNDGALSCYYCYDDNDPDTVIVFQLAADQASRPGIREAALVRRLPAGNGRSARRIVRTSRGHAAMGERRRRLGDRPGIGG